MPMVCKRKAARWDFVHFGDISPVDDDLPGAGQGQSAKQVEQGGFTRPGASPDSEKLARLNGQVGASQCNGFDFAVLVDFVEFGYL